MTTGRYYIKLQLILLVIIELRVLVKPEKVIQAIMKAAYH